MRCLPPQRKKSSAEAHVAQGQSAWVKGTSLSTLITEHKSASKMSQDHNHQSRPLSCMERDRGPRRHRRGAQEVKGAGTRGPQGAGRESAQTSASRGAKKARAQKARQLHEASDSISEVPRILPFRFFTGNLWYFSFSLKYFFRLAINRHSLTPNTL